jgi:hypothetical protein
VVAKEFNVGFHCGLEKYMPLAFTISSLITLAFP